MLCTYHLGKDAGDFEIKRIGQAVWYKKLNPGFSWGKIWLDFKLLLLCVRQAKKFKPDVIHAHLFEGLAIGFFVRKFASLGKIPIVADLQGDLDSEFESYNKEQSLARSFFVWLSKTVIMWADWIVLSSENARKSLLKIYKQEEKISIIKDGVDIDFFANPVVAKGELKKELEHVRSWKEGYKTLIYTGGMEDSKGVSEFLEEFVSLMEDNEELRNSWKLIMFGDGGDKEKYKKMVEGHEMRGNVFFTNETGFFALPHFLKLADVGIDPKSGSTESSGKLVNYMAAGLPVICFENDFNRARVGNNGRCIKEISELKNILKKKNSSPTTQYGLDKKNEEREVLKLLEIFKSQTNVDR